MFYIDNKLIKFFDSLKKKPELAEVDISASALRKTTNENIVSYEKWFNENIQLLINNEFKNIFGEIKTKSDMGEFKCMCFIRDYIRKFPTTKLKAEGVKALINYLESLGYEVENKKQLYDDVYMNPASGLSLLFIKW